MGNQGQANQVRQSLEDNTFGANRHAFEIDVEELQAIPNYTGERRLSIRYGIADHRTFASNLGKGGTR